MKLGTSEIIAGVKGRKSGYLWGVMMKKRCKRDFEGSENTGGDYPSVYVKSYQAVWLRLV